MNFLRSRKVKLLAFTFFSFIFIYHCKYAYCQLPNGFSGHSFSSKPTDDLKFAFKDLMNQNNEDCVLHYYAIPIGSGTKFYGINVDAAQLAYCNNEKLDQVQLTLSEKKFDEIVKIFKTKFGKPSSANIHQKIKCVSWKDVNISSDLTYDDDGKIIFTFWPNTDPISSSTPLKDSVENPVNEPHDLSSLRKWSSKDPLEKINGHNLFEDKNFKSTLKKIVGPKIYKDFMESAINHGKYFQPLFNYKNGIIEIYIDNFYGAQDFNVSFYIDTINNNMEVCWNDAMCNFDNGKNCTNEIYLHDGRKIKIKPDSCRDIDYNNIIRRLSTQGNQQYDHIQTKEKSNASDSQESSISSNLTGNWTGDFQLTNPHGKKYTAHYSYIISQDQSNPSKLTFKQINTLAFINKFDAFSCNMSNTYTNSYEGIIKTDGQEIKFVQQKISNPSCGSPDTDTFRLNGSSLEAVHVDGGKITTGTLHR